MAARAALARRSIVENALHHLPMLSSSIDPPAFFRIYAIVFCEGFFIGTAV